MVNGHTIILLCLRAYKVVNANFAAGKSVDSLLAIVLRMSTMEGVLTAVFVDKINLDRLALHVHTYIHTCMTCRRLNVNFIHACIGHCHAALTLLQTCLCAMPNVEALSNINRLTTNSISRCIVVPFCGWPSLSTAKTSYLPPPIEPLPWP